MSDGLEPCEICEAKASATSVMDDIGMHDESASVVIIGGGPHSLAALSALHEGRLRERKESSDGSHREAKGRTDRL